ncbi:MAG: hypothetical protein RLZZ468_2019 [Cyanobacteriota bacterium]
MARYQGAVHSDSSVSIPALASVDRTARCTPACAATVIMERRSNTRTMSEPASSKEDSISPLRRATYAS